MGRAGGTVAIASLAAAEGRPMRATIPAFAAKRIGLIGGDRLDRELDRNGGARSAAAARG